MLELIFRGEEFFDEASQEFSTQGDVSLELEHSLVSLSKWESKFKKPFLSSGAKTPEEILFYIEAMIITPGVSPEILSELTEEHIEKINAYIESSESATTFGAMPERKGRGEIITAELIYYWMVAFNIPFECERWHLNRLFALVRICNVKNSKPKKMSRREMAEHNNRLNEQRKAQWGTKG